MTDAEGQEPLVGPIVSRGEWRVDAAPLGPNIAAVIVYADEVKVLWPDEPRQPPLRPVEIYQVDIRPHRSSFSVTLPAKGGGEFLADVYMVWRVLDPAAVVRDQVTDVQSIVSREFVARAGAISARFTIYEARDAEYEISSQLPSGDWPGRRRVSRPPFDNGDFIGARYGLWTRLFISLVHLIAAEASASASAPSDEEPRYEELVEQPPLADVPHGQVLPAERRDPPRSDQADERLDLPQWLEYEEPEAALDALPPTYDEIVEDAFAKLVEPGRLLFNPPDRMQLGKTARVEVRLARTLLLDTELLEGLRGLGTPHIEDIKASPLMAVTLKGEGFKITAYSDEEQRVSSDQITTWEYDIKALKRGQQRLVISVSLRVPIPGQPTERKSIPVREATIEVEIGAAAALQFVTDNWQWFVGTAIAIGGLITAIVVH